MVQLSSYNVGPLSHAPGGQSLHAGGRLFQTESRSGHFMADRCVLALLLYGLQASRCLLRGRRVLGIISIRSEEKTLSSSLPAMYGTGPFPEGSRKQQMSTWEPTPWGGCIVSPGLAVCTCVCKAVDALHAQRLYTMLCGHNHHNDPCQVGPPSKAPGE